MEYTGKIEQMLQDAQEYRLHCYRRMLLADMVDIEAYENNYKDYSIQDYQQERIEASENAVRLLDYIDIHTIELSPEEKSELLLTAFVALNAGFRNYEQSLRATDIAEVLLPTLPDSRIKLHLLVYLYRESGEEIIQKDKERMMVTAAMTETEEDGYLHYLYQQMSEQCFSC